LIGAADAESAVLRFLEPSAQQWNERMVIHSCALSPNGDFWIVRANTAGYVLHGRLEAALVGVNAYLVDVKTGSIDIVGSGQSLENYLQDIYDLRTAGSYCYVLGPSFDWTDKQAVINLRRQLDCSLVHAKHLLGDRRKWLTGKRRVLELAAQLLEKRGIASVIALEDDAGAATLIDEHVWHWDALKQVLQQEQ